MFKYKNFVVKARFFKVFSKVLEKIILMTYLSDFTCYMELLKTKTLTTEKNIIKKSIKKEYQTKSYETK